MSKIGSQLGVLGATRLPVFPILEALLGADGPKSSPRAPQERPKSAKTNMFDDFCNACLILFFNFYVLLLYLTSTTVARFWVDFWTDVERYCCRLLVFVLIPD